MRLILLILTLGLLTPIAPAQFGPHPTVHDAAADIVQRLRESLSEEELLSLTAEEVRQFLTEEDWEILGKRHLSFRVDVPVTVYVFRDSGDPAVVHWMPARGFENSGQMVKSEGRPFEVWARDFPAGEIGLGVPSIDGEVDHYFVGVAPQDPADQVAVRNVMPPVHTAGTLEPGERFSVSWNTTEITEVPDNLRGITILRGSPERRKTAELTAVYQTTPHPATPGPDQVVLTWGGDPRTEQSIQWRTSTETDGGAVRFRVRGSDNWQTQAADTRLLENHNTINDPLANRHTVRLRGLTPGTEYEYQVGAGAPDGWLPPASFRTAPGGVEPFSFVYLGDAQIGFETWGKLLRRGHREHPEAAFYIMAGDLVNRGNERADWDRFFAQAGDVFAHRPLVPTIGNHEDQGDKGPWMYLELLDLPENGPAGITPERVYSFTYSNVLVVALDPNVPPARQTDWLEAQLANTDATWKFVTYHQPAYSSSPTRDNPEVRELWGPIFDKYHVDLALQGHDHAYLRTYPMYADKPVDSPAEGTIYIVSNAGEKHYDQGEFEYKEVGFTNIPTYQVLDIEVDGDRLTYKARGEDGEVLDEFVIQK